MPQPPMCRPDFRKSVMAATLAIMGLAVFPVSQAEADVEQGRIVAERWCASCHLVSPGQDMAADQATTFMQIAAREDLTAERLRTFLQAPHPPMPDLQLTRNEINALVSYIESLD